MHPQLFDWLGIPFPSYFTLVAIGFLVATAVGALWAKRVGHDPDVVVDLGIAMVLAGVVGARLLHVIADGYFWDYVHLCTDPSKVAWHISADECLPPTYEAGAVDWARVQDYFGCGQQTTGGAFGSWDAVRKVCVPAPDRDWLQHVDRCLEWAKPWAGGLTYYGGFIGASAAAVFVLRRDRFPFWRAADMAGFVVPLGLAFGRMGCLLGGCCFGAPTTKPWGLSFPGHSPASDSEFKLGLLASPSDPSLAVHPTQVYESAAALGIAALTGLVLHGKKRYDGEVFLSFVVLYAVVRFGLEFVRSDDRGGLLGLSTSQLIGIALVAAAFVLHRGRLSRVEC
ncbi:MAG: prolipoprotein diacylglyceryl transferase [Polyangiaceae bacterium]|nr:prolipoprotein diacylglyceryl transferase [Polyangiaceae bacterium]